MQKSPRDSLVEITAQLLERQGYHATGLNQIVRESETPRGSLYYYFPDGKEELAAAAIKESGHKLSRHIRQQLALEEEPAQAVYQFLVNMAAHVEAAACSAGAPLATVALEAPATSERLRAACQAAYAELHDAFFERLRAGGFADERAHALATVILAAVEGGIILSRANHSADPILTIAGELKTLLVHR